MFPVAWRVFQMPGGSAPPSVASEEYKLDLTAYVAGSIDSNTIVGPDSKRILKGKNTFQVSKPGSLAKIDYDAFSTRATAAIVNNTLGAEMVGIADINGKPYISVKVHPKHMAEFQGTFEFAICAVDNIVEGQVLFKADTLAPWISFTSDTANPVVEVSYDGNNLTVTGADITQHEVTESIFGPPS